MIHSIFTGGLVAALLVLSALPAGAMPVACGDVIGPAKGTVVVDNDLTGCAGAALRVVGPVTVDLGPSFVICADGASSTGVFVEGRGATVRGGRVVDCTVGVQLRGRDHRVRDMRLDDNFIGVFVDAADRSRVERVHVDGGRFGIQVQVGTQRNTIVDSEIENVELFGLDIAGTRQRVERTVVRSAGQVAVTLRGARHTLVGNEGRADEIGFVVQGSEHSLIGNRVFRTGDGAGLNDGIGFLVSGARHTLRDNVARQNLGLGFRLVGVEALRAERNRAEQNGDGGFLLVDGVRTELRKNTAFGNFGGHGIHVTGAGTRTVVVRENSSLRHFAPFQDLRDDDPSCAETRWIANEFDRGAPACVQ